MYEHTGFRIYLKCSTIGCKTGLKLCGDPGGKSPAEYRSAYEKYLRFFVRMMSAAKEAMAASFSGGQSSMTIT